jgi:hypothetical protein
MPQPASTQSTLSILDIKDDIVVLGGGRYRVVLRVKAINFDLLSEDEQDSIIYAYGSLINALEFPIQVLVKTRQLNIESYIKYLERFKQNQPNQALRSQIDSYQSFVQKLVVENNVLFKTFYVIIPQDMVITDKATVLNPLSTFLPNSNSNQQTYSLKEFEEAKQRLAEKQNQIMSSFQRIGLRTTPISGRELIETFYELYNPEVSHMQQIRQEVDGYTTPMVHPSVR